MRLTSTSPFAMEGKSARDRILKMAATTAVTQAAPRIFSPGAANTKTLARNGRKQRSGRAKSVGIEGRGPILRLESIAKV